MPSESSSGSNGHKAPMSNGHSNGNSQQADTAPASSNGSSSDNSHQREHAEIAVSIKSGPAWTPSDPTCPAWSSAWSSICEVWASKWNHRAWLSRQSAGLPEGQLAVSVLIQQVGIRRDGVRWFACCVRKRVGMVGGSDDAVMWGSLTLSLPAGLCWQLRAANTAGHCGSCHQCISWSPRMLTVATPRHMHVGHHASL